MYALRAFVEALRSTTCIYTKTIGIEIHLTTCLLCPRYLILDVQPLPLCAHGLINPLALCQPNMFADVLFQRLSSRGAFIDGYGPNTGDV